MVMIALEAAHGDDRGGIRQNVGIDSKLDVDLRSLVRQLARRVGRVERHPFLIFAHSLIAHYAPSLLEPSEWYWQKRVLLLLYQKTTRVEGNVLESVMNLGEPS